MGAVSLCSTFVGFGSFADLEDYEFPSPPDLRERTSGRWLSQLKACFFRVFSSPRVALKSMLPRMAPTSVAALASSNPPEAFEAGCHPHVQSALSRNCFCHGGLDFSV